MSAIEHQKMRVVAGMVGRAPFLRWFMSLENMKETHVYLWRIHFDIWQNYYNYVKFKNKIKFLKKRKKKRKYESNSKSFLNHAGYFKKK